jgi:diguanylate cyclase (GGDEF)-like protein
LSEINDLKSRKWNAVERGCAPIAQVILVFSLYLGGLIYALSRHDRQQLINVDVVQSQLPIFTAIIIGAIVLLITGLILKTRRPNSLLFQHICAQYFGLSLVWAGYLFGTQSFATGTVLIGAVLSGYIALERRVIQLGALVAFGLILILNVAANTGWIPYAPARIPPYDGASFSFWAQSAVFLAAPHVILSVTLTAIMIRLWRQTEAKVLRQSRTDALTGLHNRGSIVHHIHKEIARTKRHGPPLAVVILDLDHFKNINDRWGHPAGDNVLRAAAQCLTANTRSCDVISRFGGEEFLLLIPDTSIEGAMALMERCRLALSHTELYSDNGERIQVSASFGIACNENNRNLDRDALIQAADKALYRAKQQGRNRIELASIPVVAKMVSAPSRPNNAKPLTRIQTLKHLFAITKRMLEQLIQGGPEWTPTMKTALLAGLGTLQFLLYGGWGLFLLILPNRTDLLNIDHFISTIPIAIPAIVGMAMLSFIGVKINKRYPDSRLYQHFTQQYYAVTLVGFGYLIGTLSLPVGILLVGSPLIGLIFFRPLYVWLGMFTSMSLLLVLSAASAMHYIPYAPVIAQPAFSFYVTEALWLAGLYILVIPNIIIIIYLSDRTFGHWRERGIEARTMSLTDALTGTHNRRSIIAMLDKELARTLRHGPPLALILLDMDHFKQINDTWGHPTGDRALKAAATALSEAIRECDAIGRFGGEEFLILLPDTTLEGSEALAERCRTQLEQCTVLSDDGTPIPVSASFGLTCNEHCLILTSNSLIKAADDALYTAKSSGRNRVEIVHAEASRMR